MGKALGTISTSICLLAPHVAFGARTLYVAPPPFGSDPNPGTQELPFATIQKGIDASSNGDTVVVAQGTYVENLRFNGKNIVLRSTDPLSLDIVKNTIIDGNQAGSVVRFSGTENETCVLSGFTIRNGKGRAGGGVCGGTWDAHARATISNSVLSGNSAARDSGGEGSGGGVAYCDGVIKDNVITGNWARDHGGGVAYSYGAIERNSVAGNSGGAGGALAYCYGTIENNVISGNSARWGSGGGLYQCRATIRSNLVRENWAGAGGGLSDCVGTIRNCVIVGNSGGGLGACEGAIENCTIVGNSAGYSGGGLSDCEGGPIRNCIIWANRAPYGAQVFESVQPVNSCIQDWRRGGVGNIVDDPCFIDADGPDNDPETSGDNDYRLAAASPCIDAGKNEAWMWTAADFDGRPRVWFGASSWTVDMGAYEFQTHRTYYVDDNAPGDPAPGDPSISDPNEDGTRAHPFDFVQEAIDGAEDGDFVIVADGVYEGEGWQQNVVADFRGKAITLRSQNGPRGCVLSNGQYVVRFSNGEGPASVLCGFTIRGAEPGGGILCYDSSPTIMNNIITENRPQYGDGAILVRNSSAVIIGNVISGNKGYGQCAGIVVSHGSSATMRNNTIVGHGYPGHKNNGGVSCEEGASVEITNGIFWGNGDYDLYGCSATYSCLEHESPGTGNISVNPLFVVPAYWDDRGTPEDSWDDVWVGGDYRLQSESPCIDAGDNSVLTPPGLDLDGNLRIAFGGKSQVVDMGAYEYDSKPFALAMISPDQGGRIRLVWYSQPSDMYVIWSCADPSRAQWTRRDVVAPAGGTTVWYADAAYEQLEFYRVEMK